MKNNLCFLIAILGLLFPLRSFSAAIMNIKKIEICVSSGAYEPPSTQGLIEVLQGGGRPDPVTEAWLSSFAKVLNDKLYLMKIRNSKAQVLLNYCGPKAITVELPENRLEAFLSAIEDLGATYRLLSPSSSFKPSYTEVHINQVLVEANLFLSETAYGLLNARSVHEAAEICVHSNQAFEKWDKYERSVIGRTVQNGVITNNEDIRVKTELKAMCETVRKLWALDSRINQQAFEKASQPYAPSWGLSVEQLEKLKELMPSVKTILSEQQEVVGNHDSLSEAQKKMEARISFLKDVLYGPALNLADFEVINTDSYELYALLFLKTIEKIESLQDKDGSKSISNFEIVDFLNRYLTLFQHTTLNYKDHNRVLELGPYAVQAYQKILSYDRLDPYIRLLLTAVLSEAGPTRIVVNSEVLKSYETMWSEMPMEESLSRNTLVPKKHFGELASSMRLGEFKVIDGIDEIENWLASQGVKTKAQSERQGTSLEIARSRYAEARKDFLKSRGESCSSVLGDWLQKNKPK